MTAAAIRRWAKRVLFGSEELSQQCAMAMNDLQAEVTIWLEGLGTPRDVTARQLMACGSPFLIGVGLGEDCARVTGAPIPKLILRHGEGEELGSIELLPHATLAAGRGSLCLFAAGRTRLRCLPRRQLWARYLLYAYQRWRTPDSEFCLPAREVHAMIAFYLCPRPVALVSVCDASGAGNIFPMNLMGRVHDDLFAFALKRGKPVTGQVARAGRIALSTVPFDQRSWAYHLAGNHRKESVDWEQLPFATAPSSRLGFPVPQFALTVQEMEVAARHEVGSHSLFLARTLHEERRSEAPQFCLAHEIYASWKQRANKAERTGAAGRAVSGTHARARVPQE